MQCVTQLGVVSFWWELAAKGFANYLLHGSDGRRHSSMFQHRSQKEKKLLETKRLDLDSCKSRLRKAKSVASQTQAEADLRSAQAEFDRQAEITKLLLEGITSTHAHHLRCLNDFIEAQMTYYAQCQQYMSDLQKQLGSGGEGNFVKAFSELLTNPQDQKEAENFTAVSTMAGTGNSSAPNSLGAGPHSSLRPDPSAPPAIQVTAATPNVEKKQARVLYDYEAGDSSELSLLADELITVYKLPKLDADWFMAERGPYKGKVPTTYLEVLE